MATPWNSHGAWTSHQPYAYQAPPVAGSPHYATAPAVQTNPGNPMMFDANTEIFCDQCRQHIPPGVQWHCSSPTCSGGDFDLCDPCHTKGADCHCHVGLFALRIFPGRGRDRTVLPPTPAGGYTHPPPPMPHGPSTTPSHYHPTPVSQQGPFTPPYSPPTSSAGVANPFTSPSSLAPLPPTSATSSKPLQDLLPSSVKLKVATDNPAFKDANTKYNEYIKSTAVHTNPAYESHNSCATPQQYDIWLEQTHKPQEASYQKVIASLNGLVKLLAEFVNKENGGPRSGLDNWKLKEAWPTKDGEICDTLDFMDRVLAKVDEVCASQAKAQDLNNRNWVGSRGAYDPNEIQRLNDWYIKLTLETRGNAAREKYQRRKDHLELVRKIVSRSDEKERAAFEDILASASSTLSAPPASAPVGSGIPVSNVDMLAKAVEVLSVHLEWRKALQVRLCNASLHEAEAERAWKLTQMTDKSQEPIIMEEGNRKMWDVMRIRDETIRRLCDDWDYRVNRPIVPHIKSMQISAAAAQGIAPLLSANSVLPGGGGHAAQFYSTPMAGPAYY